MPLSLTQLSAVRNRLVGATGPILILAAEMDLTATLAPASFQTTFTEDGCEHPFWRQSFAAQ